MANEIVVGNPPTNRPQSIGAGWTYLDRNVQSNGKGLIHTVQIYVNAGGPTWNMYVGLFYPTVSDKFKCRAAHYLGLITSAGYKSFSVSMPVEVDDWIGWYCNYVTLKADNSGGLGLKRATTLGNGCVVNDERSYFNASDVHIVSVRGLGDIIKGGLGNPIYEVAQGFI